MGESNPGPHACQKGTLPLSYILKSTKFHFLSYPIPGQLGTHDLTKTFLLSSV